MCIGIPMQVLATRPGFAQAHGRGEVREVNTALVGEPAIGEWLLVFIDAARERIGAERAQEVNATLDLLEAALGSGEAGSEAGFTLPSAMGAAQLAALTGTESTGTEQP